MQARARALKSMNLSKKKLRKQLISKRLKDKMKKKALARKVGHLKRQEHQNNKAALKAARRARKEEIRARKLARKR